MRFVAFTIKGLEEVAKKEITSLLEAVDGVALQVKAVHFNYTGSPSSLLNLKTVDDIGILLNEFNLVKGDNLVFDLATFDEVLKYIRSFREIENTFSITTSIVSQKIDNESAIAKLKELLELEGYVYTQTDRSNLDVRIFVNDTYGFISLRLTKEPLGKRIYEKEGYLGALKPSIAAAMVKIATAGLSENIKVVDNFCGSGTILCESLLNNYKVYGGDINSMGVTLTKQRLRMLGSTQTENIYLQDATKTKWSNDYFDCAISNIPWDKQHEINNITTFYSAFVCEYARILKSKFSLCIICHKPELLVKHIKKAFGEVNIMQYPIGYLGQTPTIVLVSSRAIERTT